MGDQSTFDFFRQETSHKDVVIRTEAMNQLALVCALMTPEKVRGDMMPYLQTKLDDLDQVLLALAKRLGELLKQCGGKDHASCMIALFEPLLAVEETVVRSAASASISAILKQFESESSSPAAQAYVNLFKKIGVNEDAECSFYNKVSAAQIADEIYRVAKAEDRPRVQEVYFALCKDEQPIVRRAAALTFQKIVPLVEKQAQAGEFLQILKTISSPDEHSTVRIIAAESYIEFIKLLNNNEHAETAYEDLINFVKNTVDDPSWRIRLAIVSKFGDLALCFSPEVVTAEIFPCFSHLLQDSEADVRTGICVSGTAFLDVVGPDVFLAEIVPVVSQLAADQTPAVRRELAVMCVDVAAKLGAGAVAQNFNDLVAKLLTDEDASVRLRVIQKVPLIAEQVPPLMDRITPQLVKLYADENWRIRKQLSSEMPAIFKHMGKDYFVSHFLDKYLKCLKDSVSEVRNAAAASLTDLLKVSDSNFVHDRIYATVKSLSSEDYFHRVTMILALKHLLDGNASERFQNEIYALVITTAADSVPNVRIATAVLIQAICQKSRAAPIIGELRPVLKELKDDKDKDVRYFAAEALKLI